jgi:hypothetical protein
MQRRQAGQIVATALFEGEDAIDQALQKASAFIAAMSAVRLENGYAATVAASAMERACSAIQSLGEARGHFVAAHGALDAARPALGLAGVSLTGTGMGKPEEDTPRPTGRLSLAA